MPAGPSPPARSHVRTVVAETVDTKAFQLADNPLVAPARVLSRETKNQRSNLPPHGRATNRVRVGPLLRDQAPMPAKEGRRGDDEGGRPAHARHKPAGSGKEKPVNGRYRRALGLAVQDGQFVPQHDDFQFLPLV